jgi:hypothetical protein
MTRTAGERLRLLLDPNFGLGRVEAVTWTVGKRDVVIGVPETFDIEGSPDVTLPSTRSIVMNVPDYNLFFVESLRLNHIPLLIGDGCDAGLFGSAGATPRFVKEFCYCGENLAPLHVALGESHCPRCARPLEVEPGRVGVDMSLAVRSGGVDKLHARVRYTGLKPSGVAAVGDSWTFFIVVFGARRALPI